MKKRNKIILISLAVILIGLAVFLFKPAGYYITNDGELKYIFNLKRNFDCDDGGGIRYYIEEKDIPQNADVVENGYDYDTSFLEKEKKYIAKVDVDSCSDIYKFYLKNDGFLFPEIIARENYESDQEFEMAYDKKVDDVNNFLKKYDNECQGCLMKIMAGWGVRHTPFHAFRDGQINYLH